MQAAVVKFNELSSHVKIDVGAGPLERVAKYAAELEASSPPKQPSSSAPQNGWTELIPSCLETNDDRINYLGFVIAVDYRHWGYANNGGFRGLPDASEDEQTLLPPGTVVEHKDFFGMVRSHTAGSGIGGKEKGDLIRGSMGMMQLLKDAVEVDGFHWYRPEVSLDRNNLHKLRDMFLGLEKDGKTPMMLADVHGRVRIITDICQSFVDQGKSFASIARDCNGAIYGAGSVRVEDALFGKSKHTTTPTREEEEATSDVPDAFIPQLLQLHPRYHDFGQFPAVTSTTTTTIDDGSAPNMVPLLKLATLTVIAFQAAFPELFPVPDQIDLLAVAPDYQVPRALRELGVLTYSNHLAALVDGKVALKPGGVEEVELRLGCVVAAEALRKMMNVSVSTIDFVLWSFGRVGCTLPHHYCVTQMY